MRKAIVDFGRAAEGAEMAVVFYAGHGMEVGGENWLIPVNAELRSDADIESEAVSLRSISLQVSKARQLGLVILDACRNNPFAAKMKRSLAHFGLWFVGWLRQTVRQRADRICRSGRHNSERWRRS